MAATLRSDASLATAPVTALADTIAPGSPARPLRDLFLAASWFALAGGLVEVTLLGVKRLVLHHEVRLGPQVVWMTPTADLLLALAVALLLAPFVRRWRSLGSPRVVASVFSFLAVLGVLLVEHWSYPAGIVVLALGAGIQVGRLVGASPGRVRRFALRTLPALAGIVLVLGIGLNAYVRVRERLALAALPAARAGAPNVLLLIWDTVRAADLGLYGYDRPTTPVLQAFAAQGATFDGAIATAPWTLPSHAGMFTGRYPHELSADWTHPLGRRWPTLAEVLDRGGYSTAGFAANTIYASYEFGLDRGFVHYEDYVVSPGQLVLASALLRTITNEHTLRSLVRSDRVIGRKTAADVNRAALTWLDHRRDRRPFFLFLNEFDAHEPYEAPEPFGARFAPLPRPQHWNVDNHTNSAEHQGRWQLTQAEIAAEHNAYDASIAYLDARLGDLLRQLTARRLLDNTIVIVAADHGEEFGRHKVFEHGNSLYVPVLHVPLVVVWPRGVPAGRRVTQHVSLADLPATVLDLADIDPVPFPGRSLARFWDPAAPGRRGEEAIVASEVRRQPGAPAWYPVAHGDLQAVIEDGFHLIRDGDGHDELYDLRTDPWEMRDLASSAAYATARQRLDRRLVPGSASGSGGASGSP